MDFFEVITDAATGEQTIRPYTDEEIALAEAAAAAAEEAARASLKLSFAQLLIGLVAEQWITQAEGEAWLQGTLPAGVTALISTLPPEQQFPAIARAARPSEVLRLDPLVVALGAAQNKTTEEIDTFFQTYSGV